MLVAVYQDIAQILHQAFKQLKVIDA